MRGQHQQNLEMPQNYLHFTRILEMVAEVDTQDDLAHPAGLVLSIDNTCL